MQVKQINAQNSQPLFRDLGSLKLWQARHNFVMQFIQKQQIRHMIDFGCSDGLLMSKIQRGIIIQKLFGIDIDQNILIKAEENLIQQGLHKDLIYLRTHDQQVELYQGSVLQKYNELKQKLPRIDLITFIEVIQHIEEKYTHLINENIFGFLKPKYVIITTPNSQFNPLFKWNDNKFRHDDHKFQWNRLQFKNYTDQICKRYGYQVNITGLGLPLDSQNDYVGYCTQIAVFTKKSLLMLSQNQEEVEQNKMQIDFPRVPLTIRKKNSFRSWLNIQQQLIYDLLSKLQYKCRTNQGKFTWIQVFKLIKGQKIMSNLNKLDQKYEQPQYISKFFDKKFKQYPNLNVFVNQRGLNKKDQFGKVIQEQQINQKIDLQQLNSDIEQKIVLYEYNQQGKNSSIWRPRQQILKKKISKRSNKSSKSSRSSRYGKSNKSQSKSSSFQNSSSISESVSDSVNNYQEEQKKSQKSQNSWKSIQVDYQKITHRRCNRGNRKYVKRRSQKIQNIQQNQINQMKLTQSNQLQETIYQIEHFKDSQNLSNSAKI